MDGRFRLLIGVDGGRGYGDDIENFAGWGQIVRVGINH